MTNVGQQPKTIILADDEVYITTTIAAKLRSLGYAVHTARNGADALRLIAEYAPAMVITDFQMPRMSGLEMAQTLFADPATSALPILMLTARGHLLDEEMRSRTNIVKLLAKPFSVKEVTGVVFEVVGPATACSDNEDSIRKAG